MLCVGATCGLGKNRPCTVKQGWGLSPSSLLTTLASAWAVQQDVQAGVSLGPLT